MLQVTKTYLPDLESYVSYLRSIWATAHITNHGPLVDRLEEYLRSYLGVKHVAVVCNGTVALQIAIKALRLSGDVVTTPFSYVATTSSVVWEGCRPIFADIERDSLCIDPDCVKDSWTSSTTAVLATHVYGNACDVEALGEIARHRGGAVIYDAAHAFGAELHGKPLSAFGDIAILSFHATKLFHTGEGGALVTDDDDLAHRIRYLRNFGHRGPEEFWDLGINGKMSEIHAALGLALIPCLPEILEQKRTLSQLYDKLLEGSCLQTIRWREGLKRNHSYYPVLLDDEATLLECRAALNDRGIYPRRYFFPPLNKLPYIRPKPMPIAEDVASRVLCLPLGHDVAEEDVSRIVGIVRGRR